ncbi:MAG TPA: hypothetical protein VG407_01455 [Caulobacteraceae bacterium]|jgi:hypothetical protein|nr:hypothetical protein [Caulobacteraceae bacterium]
MLAIALITLALTSGALTSGALTPGALTSGALTSGAPQIVVAKEDAPPEHCDTRPDCRYARSVDLLMPNGGTWHLKVDKPAEFIVGQGDDRRIALVPNESVVLRLDDHGQPNAVILSHSMAADVPPSRLEVAAEDQVTAMAKSAHPPQEGVPYGTVMPPQPVRLDPARQNGGDLPDRAPLDKDTIRFTFKQVPGTTWMLLYIENGYGRKLEYRAHMLKMGDTVEPTDVCQVMSGKPSFENWPYPFAEIEISDLRLVDGDPNQPECK